MIKLKRALKFFLSSLVNTVISLLVIFAIILSLARLALPVMENYKTEIEVWISELLNQQVEIATLDAVWYGTEPQLVLKGVQLLSNDRVNVHGYFQDVRFGLNLLASIAQRKLVPGALTLEGARFGVIRHEDGHITIQGVVTENSKSNQSNEFFQNWIFQQRILDVKNSEVVWIDHKNENSPRLFNNVNLRLTNVHSRHLIQGSVDLPEQFGSRINIAVDIFGNLLTASNWAGKGYIEVNELQISEVLPMDIKQKFYINAGVVNAKLWLNWVAGSLSSSRGELNIADVKFTSSSDKSKTLSNIKTRYALLNNQNTWNLALSDMVIDNDGKQWPASTANFRYSIETDHIAGYLQYVKMSDLINTASVLNDFNDDLARKLREMQIQGDLTSLSLNIFPDDFYISGKFSQLQNHSVDKIPGLRSVTGNFSVSRNAMELEVPVQNIVLTYPQVYRQKSELKDVTANLLFGKSGHEWDFAVTNANAKFKQSIAKGSLLLSSRANYTSPLLDLAFYIQGGSLSDAKFYIPGNIMHADAVKWIEQSLKEGRVGKAVITHFGELKQYPYLNNEGAFDVNIDLQKGALVFAADWPQISAINGNFQLNSKSFVFAGESAESLGNKLEHVDIRFPDFFGPGHYLFINGSIKGESRNKLQYLHDSPLEKLFAKHIHPLTLEGRSDVDLSLTIPLDKIKETVVDGKLVLVDNHLSSEDWKLDLTELNTSLNFSEKHIETSLITAKLFGTAVNGNIDTVTVNGAGQLLIQGGGVIDQEIIGEALGFYLDKKAWSNYLAGTSEFLVALRVPFQISNARSNRVILQLASSLKNMAVNMPTPLSKERGEIKDFQLFAELTGEKRDVNISYDSNYALLQFLAVDKALILEKGGIGFQKTATLPQERGIALSGNLPKFYWSEWEPLIFPASNVEALFAKGGSSNSMYFDVEVNDLEVFGKRFKDIFVYASQTAQNWSLNLSGESLKGNVIIPVVMHDSTVNIDLDKLYITEKIELDSKKQIDPLSLPKLNFSVKDFRFGNMDLGQITFTTSKIANGQRLEAFSMVSSVATTTANGEWIRQEDGTQKTTFSAQNEANDLGGQLNFWDFKNVMKGGKSKIGASISWPGAPADYDIKIVNGDLELEVKDASLLDFDLGAARLFSIMLPRRILLDFRDVIQSGMYFDNISGKYSLESGDAFSDGLRLRGPVADIDLAGKIGISSKTFDKVVTVNRRIVGDSLPLVGTVLSPAIGGGIFVVQKLFEKQIDDILSVQYTIEGTWGAPVITPVEKSSPGQSGNVDRLFD